MKPMTKAIHSAKAEGKVWKSIYTIFSSIIGQLLIAPPSFPLLNCYSIKKSTYSYKQHTNNLEVQSNDKKAKGIMKTYAGVKRRAEPSQIEIEDLVLARQRHFLPHMTPFHFVLYVKREQ